jgi:hypothetical protein
MNCIKQCNRICRVSGSAHRQAHHRMQHRSIDIGCTASDMDDTGTVDADDANDIHSRYPRYSEGNDLMAARMCAAVFALLAVALVTAMALFGRTHRT